MKPDKSIDSFHDRLDEIEESASSYTDEDYYNNSQAKDDNYYLDIGSEPPRFAYYRHVRIEKSNDEYRKKSCEAAYDSITQDELDYFLKAKLRVPPEQRYERQNKNWIFHDSSYCSRGLQAYDGYGCYNGECIPACRFYMPFGRIEDDEVIAEHREAEEEKRRHNTISNIDIDAKELLEFSKFYDDDD